MASVAGIEVRLDPSWFIVLLLVSWGLASQFFPWRVPGLSLWIYWGAGLLTGILFFVCVLFHELAHSLVSIHAGIPVPRITLFVFGGVSEISREPEDAATEFKIAIAGPLVSFGLWLLFFWLALACKGAPIVCAGIEALRNINLILLIFNLVPGFPLDGGRVLRAALWTVWGDFRRATYWACFGGRMLAWLLMITGFFGFLGGHIMSGLWQVLIGLFLLQAAEAAYAQAVLREGMRGMSVAEAMKREVVAVPAGATVAELVDGYFLKHHYAGYPVLDGENVLGVVALADVKEIPREDWGEATAAEVAVKIPAESMPGPGDPISRALELMSELGVGRLPVVEDGRLVGIVTSGDIMTLLHLRGE